MSKKMSSKKTKWDLIIDSNENTILYWKDIFAYKDLFLIYCWRDFSVRYKQTAIGVLWALIRPFLIMIVFTIVFGKLAN